MSQIMTAATGVTSQYAAQVTSDLEQNAKEQERINAEIGVLQEQLAVLEHDHTVLLNVQQALGIAVAPAQPGAESNITALPAPREEPQAESDADAGKPARAKKTQGRAKKAKSQTTRKSATPKPGTGAAGLNGTGATLVELVGRHLAEQSEPRSAAEVTEALVQAHPERGIKSTVVRTTLENLVSRALAQRSKQGRSVRYIAPVADGQATAPIQDEPRPEQAE
ncbi:BlaI/MecI/CopY family transcriptional regulator [Actinacidiphila acidipaludis]|uniref:Regulatory protein n=1 Tax=Actinacidiphila acidipaludis TaxID=2873382 RepID=A0ABS7QEI3_9ACTN|nr:BlaI/MecI/CopY family transcriptional regulator [Streptomyces acidipaludis]MBY8881588.1 hypothetical protein [Streptomyces acidipaludis]